MSTARVVEVANEDKGSYATRDTAVKKIQTVFSRLNVTADDGNFFYLIAATTSGRFRPVVLLNQKQGAFLHYFIGNNITVTMV